MLALTQPNDVQAVAILNPVLDWVGLDEAAAAQVPSTSAKKRISSTGPLSASEIAVASSLLQVRRKIFRVPGAYFEPQASPMHFVRAPGRDTPLSHDTPEQIEDSLMNEEWGPVVEAFGPYDDDLSSLGEHDNGIGSNMADRKSPAPTLHVQRLMKRRKVLQRWPPHGVNISDPQSTMLPYMGFFASSTGSKLRNKAESTQIGADSERMALNSLLERQSREFVQLAQRACFSRMGWSPDFANEQAKARLHLLSAPKGDIAKQVAQWFASLPP